MHIATPDYLDKRFTNWERREGNSGGETELKYRSLAHGRILHLSGYVIDEFNAIGPRCEQEYSPEGPGPWEWFLETEALFCLTSPSNLNQFMRALCWDRATELLNSPPAGDISSLYSGFRSLGQRKFGLPLDFKDPGSKMRNEDPELYDSAVSFARLMWVTALGRRMGKTKGGRLGILPPGTQVGDRVFVAFGGNDPLIVRRKQSKQETQIDTDYYLVGTCYLHGVMDGEVMRMAHVKEEISLV